MTDFEALLKEEKEKNERLSSQNDNLRKALIALQTESEQEEEKITNTLLRRIQGLQKEKEDLLKKVEEEEEIIANQLQTKLKQLQLEKVQLENTLEQEQESMVNRLQKQLDDLLRNSPSPGGGTPMGRMRVASSERKLTQIGSSINEIIAPSSNVVELLRAENNSLKSKLNEQKVSIDLWIVACQEQYSDVVKSLLEINPSSTVQTTLPSPPFISSSPSGIMEMGDLNQTAAHQRRKSAGSNAGLSPISTGAPAAAKRLTARIPLG